MKKINALLNTIGNFIVGSLIVIIVLLGFFCSYCWLVTYITPRVYEQYGKQNVELNNIPSTDQTEKVVHISNYGDNYNNHRTEVLGTFGDSSGFMNAFFSFLAFTAVGLTLTYQFCKDRKDKRIIKKSEFESVFFSMTSTLEDIVTHLEYHDTGIESDLFSNKEIQNLYGKDSSVLVTDSGCSNDKVCKGREIFRYLYCEKPFTLDSGETTAGIKGFIEKNEEMTKSEIQEKIFDGSLDHYFRYAYRILKYIDRSDLIDNHDRNEFAAILRAQFSCYELLILFINCIEIDNNKFKNLIEKYCLFNNIRINLLPQPYQKIYFEKVQKREEKEGYEKDAETEYSITAFHKRTESVRVTRLEVFQKIWELRFSKRIEQGTEV